MYLNTLYFTEPIGKGKWKPQGKQRRVWEFIKTTRVWTEQAKGKGWMGTGIVLGQSWGWGAVNSTVGYIQCLEACSVQVSGTWSCKSSLALSRNVLEKHYKGLILFWTRMLGSAKSGRNNTFPYCQGCEELGNPVSSGEYRMVQHQIPLRVFKPKS